VAEKFKALKDRLLDTFTMDEHERADALLDMPGLGDDKPSKLMDRMLGLLGGHKACFLFQRLFLRQMPADIRAHLVRAKFGEDLRGMAKAADELWSAKQVGGVGRMPAKRKPQGSASATSGASKPVGAPSGAVSSRMKAGMCEKHARFGDAAWSCGSNACTFKAQGNGQAGRQ
jgi:hypothetical protein